MENVFLFFCFSVFLLLCVLIFSSYIFSSQKTLRYLISYIFQNSSFFSGVCPVLCSQRGDYINGECQCNPGWKGKECSLRHDECEVPDCNGHGHCISGKCSCVRGYKGTFCEEGMFTTESIIL
jgi:hypothetical protein